MMRQYPELVWGNEISAERDGDQLIVTARQVFSDEQAARSPDVLRDYRNASKGLGRKRYGKASPHICFANADTDAKLLGFVRQFGPVVVSSWRQEDRPFHSPEPWDFRESLPYIVATQDLTELRDERQIYNAALVLLSELKRSEAADIGSIVKCVREIAHAVSTWPAQWEREQALRRRGMGYTGEPQWFFDENNERHMYGFLDMATREPIAPLDFFSANPVHAGHLVLCELVNAFSAIVYPWGDTPVEAPSSDIQGGIRPILYYILRREYLGVGCVGICRNIDCRELFEIERAGQQFCGEVCSRRQRQREYWENRGKKLRLRKGKSAKRRRRLAR